MLRYNGSWWNLFDKVLSRQRPVKSNQSCHYVTMKKLTKTVCADTLHIYLKHHLSPQLSIFCLTVITTDCTKDVASVTSLFGFPRGVTGHKVVECNIGKTVPNEVCIWKHPLHNTKMQSAVCTAEYKGCDVRRYAVWLFCSFFCLLCFVAEMEFTHFREHK